MPNSAAALILLCKINDFSENNQTFNIKISFFIFYKQIILEI